MLRNYLTFPLASNAAREIEKSQDDKLIYDRIEAEKRAELEAMTTKDAAEMLGDDADDMNITDEEGGDLESSLDEELDEDDGAVDFGEEEE